jgi:hypothetical protein
MNEIHNAAAAAPKLKRADYYRWVYANKPDWQKF